MSTESLLNEFATRSFRDIADQDYISARLSYRNGLYSQFYWQALQAFEKYFKAIFLYNRIKARDIKHNLEKALKYAYELPFDMELSSSSEGFIRHINEFGRFRYLEVSYFTQGPMLVQLDRAVWETRRYCRVLNYKKNLSDHGRNDVLKKDIKKSEECFPHMFKIRGGFLEQVIDSKEHSARSALIWQNAFFASRARKVVRSPAGFHAVNAPLSLNPEIIDEVVKYIFLPSDVVTAYKKANKANPADAKKRRG